MYAAQYITALTTYPDTDVSLSDEVKKSVRLFYLKIYGNSEGNLDKARAHAFSTTKEDLGCIPPTEDVAICCMHSSKFSFAKLFSTITPTYPPLHHLG